jgi:hypothetical protein
MTRVPAAGAPARGTISRAVEALSTRWNGATGEPGPVLRAPPVGQFRQ